MKTVASVLMFMFLTVSCSNKVAMERVNSEEMSFTPKYTPGPPALVYKTRGDYFKLVPILLSDDKSKIVSYPDPGDIKIGEAYPLPTRLHGGYLLDNRGIGINVAFLKMTYDEYSKLERAPAINELKSLIIDNDPLTVLCDCGNKTAYSDIAVQLNALINGNTLQSHCKKLK